ncbi:MAG: MBL fold metallo-hydrolase, partial [Myxococcales bacterium]|nr:MBL fold metallo-hydrolase [Myxococcales bacterium]
RHWNCGTLCPLGAGWLARRDASLARLVCRVLCIETERRGLVLVDTGLGLADCHAPRARLSLGFRLTARPMLDPRQSAVERVRASGYDPSDVRHIVLTHLDPDHAGGLADFPHATVHVLRAEHEAAVGVARPARRYRPAQWAHGVRWKTYEAVGEAWLGLPCVRDLQGLPPEILLVPTIGHSAGHAAVAVETAQGWLLHAGDALYHRAELDGVDRAPWLLRAMARVVATDVVARDASVESVRRSRAAHGVEVVCSHDALLGTPLVAD